MVYRSRLVEMDGGRGHITDARVAMGLGVPQEKALVMTVGIFKAPEADGEIRPILMASEPRIRRL
ncbi:hypothetical protein [Methylicorpusculum sp.]|uniref:hypothetical protein n=1 Tax=Methylicorpusculum sp. TaxID=2713644 RepID=UPI00271DBEDD|nr:hypothetical protein [Methylicorpusculum sp.]MDO8844115.1 hypothetical protein [Methylicorpusculum sp.]